VAVAGLNSAPAFRAAFINCLGELDRDRVREETVAAATGLVERHSQVGAIILECSELPPYAADVQRATGVPVFDFVAMIEFFARALDPTEFREPS
jgi:Asp/Glu/hydantoin racemase